jgi:hypothetical protein
MEQPKCIITEQAYRGLYPATVADKWKYKGYYKKKVTAECWGKLTPSYFRHVLNS